MGLFSSSTITQVSSTVYNLAGDENLRPKVMQSIIIGATLRDSKASISSQIQSALLNGTGMRQRRFLSWATHSNSEFLPEANLGTSQSIDPAVVQSGLATLLALDPNQTLRVTSAVIDDAEPYFWAEDWINQNRPELTNEDWSVDFDPTEGAQGSIIVEIAEESPVVIAAPADFLWGRERLGQKLLYVAYLILTQDAHSKELVQTEPAMFTYRLGSGNVVFDTMADVRDEMDAFFPALPLRLNNLSVREGDSDVYASAEKGYRRLTGQSLDTLLDQIEDNESIDDIDYAFLVQGVSINTADKAGKAYIYEMLKTLMSLQQVTKQDFDIYRAATQSAVNSLHEWERWEQPHITFTPTHPQFGELPPGTTALPSAQATVMELQIKAPQLPEFDQRLRWVYVDEAQFVGNAMTFDGDLSRGKAAVGDYWFYDAGKMPNVAGIASSEYERIFLFHQYATFRYRRLEIVGLEHLNYVYANTAVITKAGAALADDEESSLLIPLHYPTLKKLGLVKGTQLSTVSTYIVFNSYQQKKQRWYERGIFKIILMIASIALGALTGGAGFAAASGILGSNAAIGAALGVTSVVGGAIIGAIANSIAAMVLTTIISKVSTKVFGDKFGAIIGTLVSFVAMTYAGQFAATGTFDVDWGQLMRVDNIMGLTNSVSGAYTRWLQADTQSIYGQLAGAQQDFENEMEKVNDLSDEILGMTNGIIDPMMFSDASEYFGESSEAFIGRTLLTGSDIANLTHAMIENFADLSLELPKAIY